jgi:hypothetical protein
MLTEVNPNTEGSYDSDTQPKSKQGQAAVAMVRRSRENG